MAGTSLTNSNTTNNSNNTTTEEITSNRQLFLHQTDHPGLLLISKKLTSSDNYMSWKRSIMIPLNAKNKIKIVTGEFTKPTMDSDLKPLWERNNDMLISWILKIDEFDALEAPYMCICGCENGRVNGERDKRKRLIQFLMGLYEGKEGHFQEECYKIVGYPVGHPLHGKYQPPKPVKKSTRAVNMDGSTSELTQSSPPHATTREISLKVSFSSKSLKIPRFIDTLNTNLVDAWIIDSRATDHISITLTLMHNVKTLTTPMLVTLPNGQTVSVKMICSVIINANITLHNVFHLPSFTYNIISVSKLLHGNSISLTLTASYYIFQD
ncbi:cysteine-rich receptor-like protein kinase 8 [Tanacetum coccineum]